MGCGKKDTQLDRLKGCSQTARKSKSAATVGTHTGNRANTELTTGYEREIRICLRRHGTGIFPASRSTGVGGVRRVAQERVQTAQDAPAIHGAKQSCPAVS